MNYIKIDNCNMNNGPGLRCVVWVSGCEHHCPGCFNPETWDSNMGDAVTDSVKDLVMSYLSCDWCSGITFTGGDPMYCANKREILDWCKAIKERFPNKSVWIYTGYLFETFTPEELRYIDVLADGRFIESQKDYKKHWVGSSNQRVIDVQSSLKSDKVVLWKAKEE